MICMADAFLISKKIKKPIAILVDLKGNKIRIGNFKNDAIELKKNALVTIRFTEEEMWRFELTVQPDLNAKPIPLKFSQIFYLEQ